MTTRAGAIPRYSAVACALLALAASCPGGAPRDAEYAVRWFPADGGPRTEADVVQLLGLESPTESRFEVLYYDATPPASAPEGARTIVRERSSEGGTSEIVLKYRSAQPITGEWECALGPAAKRSSEVDVGFGDGGSITRVYSYSCEVNSDSAPPSLHAVAKPCTINVTRAAAGGFKIETWSLPGGHALLEVSRAGHDSEKELARFQRTVQKLVVAGARPTMRSKTELGSACS